MTKATSWTLTISTTNRSDQIDPEATPRMPRGTGAFNNNQKGISKYENLLAKINLFLELDISGSHSLEFFKKT